MMKKNSKASTLKQSSQLCIDVREALGLTQLEFAKKIGAGQSSVSRWEKAEAPITGSFFLDIVDLALELGLIYNRKAGKLIQVTGSIEEGQFYAYGELPREEKFTITIPRTENNKNHDNLFAYTVDDDTYIDYPKGTILICCDPSDMGREITSRDHAVIATKHPERKSMATNSIAGIKDWDANKLYELQSEDHFFAIDNSESRTVGIIKSTFNEK